MAWHRKLYWWSKDNLFSSVGQSLASMTAIALIYLVISHFLSWGVFNATFVGDSLNECDTSGACWAVVYNRWEQFLYGFYPEAERWRVNCSVALFFAGFFLVAFTRLMAVIKIAIVLLLIGLITSCLVGGFAGLTYVATDEWGGLFLTMVLAFGGIIGAFPIALLLALGRQSDMPLIKTLCIVFIEAVRGVPLISVLFMASFMLPLFLPEGVSFDKLLRALVGITLFQAAYLAEVIRGGLNALPKGQFEASSALGLSYLQSMRFVILPQALQKMIPGIVNTFIALFKDTTLVLIIGLFDFLGVIQSSITDPKWIGSALEAYVFCAIVYWLFCFGMSAYSQHLERKLSIGKL